MFLLEVYQDGRLVVAANHFDRTIQPQPGTHIQIWVHFKCHT